MYKTLQPILQKELKSIEEAGLFIEAAHACNTRLLEEKAEEKANQVVLLPSITLPLLENA